MLLARSYSHFSLLQAVPKVQALVEDAKQKGYTSISLSDIDTTSHIIEFIDACYAADIKHIPATTLAIKPLLLEQVELNHNRIALLAKNEAGYKDLLWYTTIARTEREEPSYHTVLEDYKARIQESSNIFVCLCGDGHELYQAVLGGDMTSAEKILTQYCNTFGAASVLIETLFPGISITEELAKKTNIALLALCDTLHVRLIVSPAPKYLDPSQEEAFKVIQAISAQTRLSTITLNRPQYLYSVEELKQRFNYLPESIFDTTDIESQIRVTIRKDYDKHADEAFFPNFALPEGQSYPGRLEWETYLNFIQKFDPVEKTTQEWMDQFPYDQLQQLKEYSTHIVPNPVKLLGYGETYWHTQDIVKQYVDRIEYELGIIIQKGYPSYFLVFADIMQFCRDNGIVASTRGSAAGSLVGYLMNINILDPLLYKLTF